MNMIPADTKCKLTVVPAGTTLWKVGQELKATDKTGVNGNQQFLYEGTKAIYANNGNGFLVEPMEEAA